VIIGDNKKVSRINATDAPCSIGTLKPASAWLTNDFASSASPRPTTSV
jgi:hypothetical protein